MTLALNKLSQISMKDVVDNFVEGKTYQEMLEISDVEMQRYFEVGRRYLKNRQFDEASDIFLLLATLSPLTGNLWVHAGNAEQALGRFEDALEAYSMAMLADANDPLPHYFSAEVYYEIQAKDLAKECLKVCVALIEENEHYLALKQHVDNLKRSLK